MFEGWHPADVKAAIKKRYGSMREFERKLGLPAKSGDDVLRGRRNSRTANAIRTVLAEALGPTNADTIARQGFCR